MEVFLVYLWLKLDSLLTILGVASAISFAAFILGWIPRSVEYLDEKAKGDRFDEPSEIAQKFCKWHTRTLFIGIIFTFFGLVIPSSKETAILVGTSIAVDVAKSPEGAKVAQLLRGKANELLDEQIKKLEKK